MMKKGQVLFSVYIDIEEDENTDIISSTSCTIDKFLVTSIQQRKSQTEKHIYIGQEMRYSARHVEIIPRENIPMSRWDLRSHKYYSTTEVGALKKALKRLPALVKRSKEYRDDDDEAVEYYQQYIDSYNGTIKKTLSRMIKNREAKAEKKKNAKNSPLKYKHETMKERG